MLLSTTTRQSAYCVEAALSFVRVLATMITEIEVDDGDVGGGSDFLI